MGRADRRVRRRRRRRSTSRAAPSCPGFVDSHAHLVFAGDRAGGVRGPHVRRAVRRRRHPQHGRRTRARPPTTSCARGLHAARRRARSVSGITTFETKSGYGLTVDDEARALRLAREVTDETTYLGAHVVPAEYAGRPRRLRRARDRRDARRLRAARALDRRVLRPRRVRRRPGARDPRSAGMARGLMPRIHANQLQHGDGIRGRRRGRRGVRRPLHPRHRRRHRAARRQRHRRHAAARRGVLDALAVPRRPTDARRRRHGGARDRLQPRARATPRACRSASPSPCATCG